MPLFPSSSLSKVIAMTDDMQRARAELAVTARENMKKARALFDDNLIDAREVAGQFSDWLRVNAACQAEEFPEAAGQLSATAELIDRLAAAAQHADEWVEAHARVFRELHDLRQAQAGFVLVPVEPTEEMKRARELLYRPAALRAAPEWQPIETAPEGRLVVVGWLDTEDSHYPENYEFDYLEGGLWSKHEDYVEHAHAVAPPGSQMPKEEPPYQWWMDLPAFPAARPHGVKDRQPIDGCTESNCKRCRTHPNHRGDMEHAGIGWRPDSPQEASE